MMLFLHEPQEKSAIGVVNKPDISRLRKFMQLKPLKSPNQWIDCESINASRENEDWDTDKDHRRCDENENYQEQVADRHFDALQIGKDKH